jgi:hypothetical protein
MQGQLERRHRVGALAALYLLWLALWFVFKAPGGLGRYTWDDAAGAVVTGLVAFRAAQRVVSPYPEFLAMQGIAHLLLAGSWLTYRVPYASSTGSAIPVPGTGSELWALMSDSLYAACAFAMMCAWGYLALARWQGRQRSALTIFVFGALMAGLGIICGTFYYRQYRNVQNLMLGRIDAVAAALDFAVLVTALLCLLLREPSPVVAMVVGTVVLMAADMAYTMAEVPRLIEAVWMLGQFVLLAAVVGMREALARPAGMPCVPPAEVAPIRRSGLSGIVLLMSLPAVPLSPLVWLVPVHDAWKPVLAVLSIVALLTILIWITDRFDDAIAYLREYVQRVHRSQLVSEDWRSARPSIGATLRATGLDRLLNEFRASAAELKQAVLFLGPERLYTAPGDPTEPRAATCFIVMPFSAEWSPDVHRILARACEAAGVRSVRGDDLFTPTDILEDMWQSINAAHFVIADITGRNPNVLYELGVAHTLAKPVLILSQQAGDIPIDLATRRVILYGQKTDAWREELARTIREAIEKVVAEHGITGRSR